VLVIFLVICLLATFAYRIYEGFSEESNRGDSKFVVYFECVSEYDSLIKYLSDGDAVYYAATGELLGYIHAKDGKPAVEIITFGIQEEITETVGTETVDTETAETEDESRDSYEKVMLGGEIRLRGDATKKYNADLYTVGSIGITKGSEISVYTEDAEFTLIVLSITALS
jgi:hypothetical protein